MNARERAVEPEADSSPSSWEDVYSDLAGALVSLAIKRYRLSAEDAEDALQRTAEGLMATHGTVPIRNRKGYFTTTFLHFASRISRERVSRREVAIPEDDFEGALVGDDPRARLQALISMRRAIAQLPVECRQLVQSTLEGNNVLEAARLLDWPARTAYKRRDRCWKRLMYALG